MLRILKLRARFKSTTTTAGALNAHVENSSTGELELSGFIRQSERLEESGARGA